MPIYEYVCRDCKKNFELIVSFSSSGTGQPVRCPDCGSEDVGKNISAPGLRIGASGSASSGCSHGGHGSGFS